MLFDLKNVIESEKERNLYYKFFAGYFFNELIQGLSERVKAFRVLLQNALEKEEQDPLPQDSLSIENTHASFDTHAYLILGKETDRGEFADIMIHDASTKIMIAIEVKFLSDWNYGKDIEANADRLKAIADKMQDTRIIPCLLLTRSKWENAKRMKENMGSNYGKLQSMEGIRPLILEWEDFLKICGDPKVNSYLEGQLKRTK